MQFLPACCWWWKGNTVLSFPFFFPLFSQYYCHLTGPLVVLDPSILWLSSLIPLVPTTLSCSLMLLGHIRALMLVDRGVWQNPVLEHSKQQRARQETGLWYQQPKVSVLLSCMVAQCLLKSRWAAPWFEGSASEGGSKHMCWQWASLCWTSASTRWPAFKGNGLSHLFLFERADEKYNLHKSCIYFTHHASHAKTSSPL